MDKKLFQSIMKLHKGEMQVNAMHFGENFPASWNKPKMADKLAQMYLENAVIFMRTLSMDTLLFISEIHEKNLNGRIPAYSEDDDFQAVLDDVLMQLEVWGLVDYCEGKIDVAGFLVSMVAGKLDAMRERVVMWQEMEDCAQGVLLAYGLIEERRYIKILEACFPEMGDDELLSFLLLRTGICLTAMEMPMNSETWWFHSSIEDIESWYEAIQARKNIPYREYTKDEYVDAAYRGVAKAPRNLEKLAERLRGKGISKEEARDGLLYTAFEHASRLEIRHGIPKIVADLILDSDDKESEQVLNLFMTFQNDTPLWINKGHTPAELVERMDRKAPESRSKANNVLAFPGRVGRNDLCPCGSGKKYKNCCGEDDREK